MDGKNTIKKSQRSRSGKETSWGGVSEWYHDVVEDDLSYQKNVIEPNLLRIVGDTKNKNILDLACGEGYFSRLFASQGGEITGIDIGKELIALAKGKDKKSRYIVTESHRLNVLKDAEFDVVFCVLALQNIENVKGTFQEVARILKRGGSFITVINHPAFRNPKQADWGRDVDNVRQFRKVYEYMSESKVQIDMTPGEKNPRKKKFTVSFHRPLQFFAKEFSKSGFTITTIEEWVSHKKSTGKHAGAEDKARHEIPMFMCLIGQKK